MEEVLEPQIQDTHEKGLRSDAVSLVSSVTIGLASVAPAFSIAVTLGYVVLVVGNQAPAAMLLGFIPMALTAVAYRELNRVIPDCGTTFTWATKAFQPHVGWLGGWGIVVSGVIFVANAADVVGIYSVEFVGQVFNLDNTNALTENKYLVAAIGVAFIALMTFITYRGIEGSARMQYFMVGLQYFVMAGVAVLAVVKVATHNGMKGAQTPSLEWFNPFQMGDWGSFVEAILLVIFIYWGWDTVLSLTEETKDSHKTPGRAALISTVILLGTYVVVTVALLTFAGKGKSGLGSVRNADNIFHPIAEPLLGQWGAALLILTILISTAASLQTTIMPTARSTLAMGVYGALPSRFSRVHPKYLTPAFSTILMGVVGGAFYVGFKMISENILQDTILSIGLAIAFYYGITAFAAVWYFRKDAFLSVRDFLMRLLLPLLGGLMLLGVFVKSAIDMWDEDYGYTTIGGVGGVFVMGVGALLIGVLFMIIWQIKAPPFFRGETLHHDTPVLAPEA